MRNGRKAGVPNKSSLLATYDMDRLGINPVEMLKKIYDEAMISYYSSEPTKLGDPRSQHLSVAARAATELASLKYAKLSAVAFKDFSDPGDAAKPVTTQEAIELIKKDPFSIPTEDVVSQMDSGIQTPLLPEGKS